MNPVDWVQMAKEGGAILSPFLMGALVWLNIDRKRLIEENGKKDDHLRALAEQVIVVSTELKTYLFNERRV